MSVTDDATNPATCPLCRQQGECAADCAFVTNVFPITERMLGDNGMVCPICSGPFELGDHYTTISPPDDHPAVIEIARTALEMFGDESPPIRFVVCLGCGATGREIPA